MEICEASAKICVLIFIGIGALPFVALFLGVFVRLVPFVVKGYLRLSACALQFYHKG